jgi:opacity protein-like surface antigen
MKITALFCLLTVSLGVVAQNAKHSNLNARVMHGVGVTFQEFEGLNRRIESLSQYKELRDHMATLQFGMVKEYNRIVSNMVFTAGTSVNGDRKKTGSNLRFLGVSADLGYNVLNSQRIMLYPMAGLGYEKYQARLYKDNSSVDFNTVLQSATEQNNLRPADFKNSFITYRLGAGFAIKSSKMPSHSIGLQAGYIGSFKDQEWRSSENQELKGAPEDGLGRIYATLTFLCQPKFMKR